MHTVSEVFDYLVSKYASKAHAKRREHSAIFLLTVKVSKFQIQE